MFGLGNDWSRRISVIRQMADIRGKSVIHPVSIPFFSVSPFSYFLFSYFPTYVLFFSLFSTTSGFPILFFFLFSRGSIFPFRRTDRLCGEVGYRDASKRIISGKYIINRDLYMYIYVPPFSISYMCVMRQKAK